MAILPKIVYNFNEDNATLIRDYSENSNDATENGVIIQDSTRIGKECAFDSTTDALEMGAISYLNGAAELSIHFGLQVNAGTIERALMYKGGQIRFVYDYDTNIFEFRVTVASGNALVYVPVVVGTYVDIDIVYESDVLNAYLDGVLIDSDSTQSGVIATTVNQMTIGDDDGLGSMNFVLNEFKLYNEAITTDVIEAVIDNPNGVASDNGVVPDFEVGDILYTDYGNSIKYAIVTFIDPLTTSQFNFSPLTSGIKSSSIFSKGGHLWDTERQASLLIDQTPQVCFYDGQSKSTEIFAESKKTYCISTDGNTSSKFRVIYRKEGFPSPVGGVITLEDGYSYFLATHIDLTGDRLDTNGIVSIMGTSPEVASLKSTGLSSSSYLITSEYTLSLNNVGLEHVKIISLDATSNPDQAIDWFGVNFVDATTEIGLIKNYNNVILNTMGFLNSGGITFDGTIGTVGISDTIFENAPTLTSVIFPITANITRRFRIDNSSFVSLSGETGLNVSTSATIPNEGYILNNVNFGGGGTYLSGIQSNDNKARFEGCRGINNSGNVAQYYMQGNTTATVTSSISTFFKVQGITTAGSYVEKFDVTTTSNKAIYTGSLTGFYKVVVMTSCTSGNNKELEIAIYKNGSILTPSRSKSTTSGSGRAENISSQDIVELETNDYIEVYLANNTGTSNVISEDMNVIITRIN